VRLLTKVHIKHSRRAHPDWTEAQLLEDTQRWADHAGPFPDTVTLEDVREAVASMRENQERQEKFW
jgi:hypothetical protein